MKPESWQGSSSSISLLAFSKLFPLHTACVIRSSPLPHIAAAYPFHILLSDPGCNPHAVGLVPRPERREKFFSKTCIGPIDNAISDSPVGFGGGGVQVPRRSSEALKASGGRKQVAQQRAGEPHSPLRNRLVSPTWLVGGRPRSGLCSARAPRWQVANVAAPQILRYPDVRGAESAEGRKVSRSRGSAASTPFGAEAGARVVTDGR
jgi:hypothetical protein